MAWLSHNLGRSIKQIEKELRRMKTNVHVLRTAKAFWVNKSGVRQYLCASVTAFSERTIGLHIEFPDGTVYSGNLLSNNGFNYRNVLEGDSMDYSISVNCFIQDSRILLYGIWCRGQFHGEICIHASMQNLILKTNNLSVFKDN